MIRITSAGVRGEFYLRLRLMMAQWADLLSIPFSSNSATEDYAWLGTPGGLHEVKGEKRAEDAVEYFYQVRNRTFEGGPTFKREDIERDKTNQIMAQINDFATRCGGHWMELLSTLILAVRVSRTLCKMCLSIQIPFQKTDHCCC